MEPQRHQKRVRKNPSLGLQSWDDSAPGGWSDPYQFRARIIRAQTIGCDKLLERGSLKEARNKRWLRNEGKDYEVEEGDVMELLFNV